MICARAKAAQDLRMITKAGSKQIFILLLPTGVHLAYRVAASVCSRRSKYSRHEADQLHDSLQPVIKFDEK